MKAFLIIVYLFAGQFPTETKIELPDLRTCQALKAHFEATEPAGYNSTLTCVEERTA